MSDLASDVAALTAALPIALLPVRLETRFSTSPAELRIRVYPDEIYADAHRPQLTDEEVGAGKDFWNLCWGDAIRDLDAWRLVTERFGVERGAWIVERTTPTNIENRPAGVPNFPVVAIAPDALPTVVARLLPTAWMAIGYRGGIEIHRVTGNDIVSPLRLSFRGDLAEGDPTLASKDELTVDRELLWAIDFAEASAVGMALTMSLTATDLAQGFDRLLVLGVRAASPTDSASELATLLDAHHYTRGLAFVRQGTPTNGTQAAPSGYPPVTDAAHTFAVERGATLVGAGADGLALAHAFGVPTAPFAHVDGANRTEQAAAAAMNTALWPCTLGYFLEQLMTPLLNDAQIADVRAHFTAFVRGRGPLPAVRIGHVPYGILPTTTLAHWKATTGTIDTGLAGLLAHWREQYLARSGRVPRLGSSGDPDVDLLAVLNRDAASTEVRAREVMGPAFIQNLLPLLFISPALEAAARALKIAPILADVGIPGTTPRIAGLTLANTAPRIARELVAPAPLAEAGELTPNYIRELRTSSISALKAAGESTAPSFANPLLYHLLRQGTLVEYARIGVGLAITAGVAAPADRLEHELHHITPGSEARLTIWERFAAAIPGVTDTQQLGKWLLANSSDTTRAPVRAHQAALLALETLPTAELTRLLTETLDTCSHRLDAWITSLATRRLATMRAATPTGIHVGGFGWVENLRRRTAPRPGTAGGFIHAPSAAHAAAAAVLRNAHLTRTGDARAHAAIDLSSQRVRGALKLIDAVRQGQPLGAVLGYRFERALHEASLDKYIARFRAKFPLGADPTFEAAESTERIPARNVVDGLALRTKLDGHVTSSDIPWGELAVVDVGDRPAMAACLARLEVDVDSTADLLLAESVYQAVQGNTDRASATLAALAGGGDLPEPQIASQPRGGLAFTNRVAVLLGAPSPTVWAPTPRSVAEPRLDAWVGGLLGNPANVRARVTYQDLADGLPHTETVTVLQLGLSPLDAIALARATLPDGTGELAARLTAYIRNAHATIGPEIAIDHRRVADEVTLLELCDVARTLGEVVDGARALTARDLIVPGANDAIGAADDAELEARAVAVTPSFANARTVLSSQLQAAVAAEPPASLDDLRSTLLAAVGLGVRTAVPASFDDLAAEARAGIFAQATATIAELDRRLAAAGGATTGLARLQALFGPELRIVPPFSPSNRAELDAAIANGPTLVGDAYAPRRWFEGAARVRPHLAELRLATLAAEATSGNRFELRIAQLPHSTPPRPWVGGMIDAAMSPPPAGALSLALHRPVALPPGGPLAGLLLDEWAELIPAAVQETAYAVHHDAPGAEAAQCVLLAVPPDTKSNWQLSALIDILHETLDLAAIRALDPEDLDHLGLFAPTTFLAANLAGDTVATHLTAQTIGEDLILAAE